MARIFVTGSSDGIGQLAAARMVDAGHTVVLHARNEHRATAALAKTPGAADVVAGELSTIQATCDLADRVNQLGEFDAVIHNAAIGYREPRRVTTIDGLSQLLTVNSLAPYILTALIKRPKRLIYISSGMHQGADASLRDLNWTHRRWNGSTAYAESKLHNVILAFAVARKWPEVLSNAVEPGWVPTKLGGASAPGDLQEGAVTQAWLAVSDDNAAKVTGAYFYHLKQRKADSDATDPEVQDRFMAEFARLSGIPFPDDAVTS